MKARIYENERKRWINRRKFRNLQNNFLYINKRMKKQKKKTLKEIILTDELVFSDKPVTLYFNQYFCKLNFFKYILNESDRLV